MTEMIYRTAGRSGLRLSAISLGAWANLGESGAEDLARRCVHRAFDLGITHFDLANNYGDPPGNAEAVVGAILAELPRDEFVLATKAGYPMWDGPYGAGGSRKHLIASCDQSLGRLGVDYVDIFYSHRPDPATPIEETMGALATLVDQGKALYVGVSSYLGEQFTDAVGAAELARLRITVVQPYYNMLDRTVETELVPHLDTAGAGMIAFAPLASGLLTDTYLDGHDPGDRRAGIWPGGWVRSHTAEERTGIINGLNDIAADRGQSLPQMAISWALRLPETTSVAVGASSPDQIEHNVGSLEDLEFESGELAAIDRLTGNR